MYQYIASCQHRDSAVLHHNYSGIAGPLNKGQEGAIDADIAAGPTENNTLIKEEEIVMG